MLDVLARAGGRVVSRDELTAVLHQREATPFERAVDVHVSHLRRKIEAAAPDAAHCRLADPDGARRRLYLLVGALIDHAIPAAPHPPRVACHHRWCRWWRSWSHSVAIIGPVERTPDSSLPGPADRRRSSTRSHEGDRTAVSPLLRRLDESLGATHHLTDNHGIDLVTGEDRSALLNVPRPLFGPPRSGDNLVVVEPSADGRYRLIISAPPLLDVWSFVPYFVVILAAIGLLGWFLARTIVTPLRAVAGAVDLFGRGELGTRVHTGRRDEIGHLGEAFNQMAARIETLLTAERRLLQDISHELRSPLARLNIAIELARTADDRDAAAASIAERGRSPDRAGRIAAGSDARRRRPFAASIGRRAGRRGAA